MPKIENGKLKIANNEIQPMLHNLSLCDGDREVTEKLEGGRVVEHKNGKVEPYDLTTEAEWAIARSIRRLKQAWKELTEQLDGLIFKFTTDEENPEGLSEITPAHPNRAAYNRAYTELLRQQSEVDLYTFPKDKLYRPVPAGKEPRPLPSTILADVSYLIAD
jgi:hypothetical protein